MHIQLWRETILVKGLFSEANCDSSVESLFHKQNESHLPLQNVQCFEWTKPLRCLLKTAAGAFTFPLFVNALFCVVNSDLQSVECGCNAVLLGPGLRPPPAGSVWSHCTSRCLSAGLPGHGSVPAAPKRSLWSLEGSLCLTWNQPTAAEAYGYCSHRWIIEWGLNCTKMCHKTTTDRRLHQLQSLCDSVGLASM